MRSIAREFHKQRTANSSTAQHISLTERRFALTVRGS